MIHIILLYCVIATLLILLLCEKMESKAWRNLFYDTRKKSPGFSEGPFSFERYSDTCVIDPDACREFTKEEATRDDSEYFMPDHLARPGFYRGITMPVVTENMHQRVIPGSVLQEAVQRAAGKHIPVRGHDGQEIGHITKFNPDGTFEMVVDDPKCLEAELLRGNITASVNLVFPPQEPA